MSRHSNRAWRRHRILGILIVVCTVALAGKLFFSSRTGPESTAAVADLSVKKASPVVSEKKPEADRLQVHTAQKPAQAPPRDEPPPAPGTDVGASSIGAVLRTAIEAPQAAPRDNAGLTLQALVWSEQSEERFVVINDSILREGGVINGSIVSRIEPDYVTIRSGGTIWKLKY